MPQSLKRLGGLALLLVFVFGCQTPRAVKQIQAKNPLAKNVAKTPTKIVDVWNSYAQTTPDGKVMRGIAGRIHFYGDQKPTRSVKVDGNLSVFVFDGNETDPAHTKPLKVFQFQADTLNKHYAFKKPLGHGYDFFLPLDEIGGEEKPLCVMARFDDQLENRLVMAAPVNTVLAGSKPQNVHVEPTVREFLESHSLLADANQHMVEQYTEPIQQAGYVSEKKSVEPESHNISTIPLNNGMTRRLIQVFPKNLDQPQ
jgi:hypothetical protein